MSIYNIDGNMCLSAYALDGSGLSSAYDVDGNLVFSSAPLTIKAMTYNVGGWYIGSGTNVPADKKDIYLALQTGMIEDNDPDILFINEYLANFCADGTSALTILQEYFPYVHTKTNGNYGGRAICSKYPITNYQERSFNDGTVNYYDSCTITIGNRAITAVVTHLNYNASSQDTRLAQTATLIAYLGTLNTFICGGDFNTINCKSTAGSDYTDVILPLLNAGYNCANCSTHGFLETYSDQPDATWTGCLDNIITSSNIPITSAHVDTTKLTDDIPDKVDHMPLIATITIN